MARGPFQGTWQPNIRPTVVTAPDALVYINGESDVISCPVCKKKFPFSRYLTSIQVDLNIDSPPGSANINLSIPRHAIDDFMYDGKPLVSPMMEIEIYAKGYYTLEGLPQYYPIFWGLVTDVSDDYSGGEHTVAINCADILKWWELCKMNINAAYTGPSGQMGRSLFGNVFFGKNPYDVILSLAQQSFGDVIVGTGSLTSLNRDAAQPQTFNAALGDLMAYWNERFGRVRSNLMLYGINGSVVRGSTLEEKLRTGKVSRGDPIASTAVRNMSGGDSQGVFDPTSKDVVAFRTQVLQAGTVNFWQSEYQTKLELANAAKEAIGFEFYMDVTGDIVFKPPFYNMDILSNKPVSWIQDIDIIDWGFSNSESEVVTQLTIQGNFTANADYGLNTEELTPYTSVTDYHLLRSYGWRSHSYNSEFLGDTQLMFYHGLDVLDRINSKRHRGSITIPMRPELRLGFPVYVAPKDQIWYLQGISHNIQFGGRATTTLTLTACREKFKAPRGIGTLKMTGDMTPPKGVGSSPKREDQPKENSAPTSKFSHLTLAQLARKNFTLDIGAAAETPPFSFDPLSPEATKAYEPLILRHPKTGRVCGYPNVVMVYTRPFANITLDEVRRATGQNRKGNAQRVSKENRAAAVKRDEDKLKETQEILTDENIEKLTKAHNANRWRFGLNSAGVFVYAHETEQVLKQFTLLPATNISVKQEGQDKKNPILTQGSAMIRPVSDERGFEVVGHYPYGRGVSLRDGQLVLTNPKEGGGANKHANVGVQLALTGDLSASLHAQSQGLTTISTTFPNPAETLAKLSPDPDLQTAAVITPGAGAETAKFVNTGDTFMDVAPLGSPEQKGSYPSVEASQFSRALTLSEMSVKDESAADDDGCGCAVRADLAFISVGYAIKPTNQASPDIGLFNQNVGGNELIGEGGATIRPAELKTEDVVSKVETYLFNLYKALDESHHEYERTLRGEFAPKTGNDGFDVEGTPRTQEFGDLSPPFGASNRASLGDPVATALQGSSAASDLKTIWKNFGENLQKQTDKTESAAKSLALKNRNIRLKKQLQDLESQPGSQFDITAQKAALRKQIADNTTQIVQLEAEIGVR